MYQLNKISDDYTHSLWGFFSYFLTSQNLIDTDASPAGEHRTVKCHEKALIVAHSREFRKLKDGSSDLQSTHNIEWLGKMAKMLRKIKP